MFALRYVLAAFLVIHVSAVPLGDGSRLAARLPGTVTLHNEHRYVEEIRERPIGEMGAGALGDSGITLPSWSGP
ncbi:hypothetical protein BDY19DRAFT_990483 [Irpex rosettiformis]|uniref:Uncharacterized protein n=1 Tax=Irpex rosettiformis TaxID=378272 RepID=A0ACB8UF64_9APHY|nr:hypothetical protein BDY19DRAFT_990483 [Irpex rosettiformis]